MIDAREEVRMTEADDTPAPVVELTRTFKAPPETVWRGLTDSVALAAWFWPARLSPRAETDVRVGGRYRIASAITRTASSAIGGEYLEVQPPERLVFTWCWEGDDSTSRVTVELADGDEGTELSLRHDQLADEEESDARHRGWRDSLDRLPEWLNTAD
jgi:uncharacterized protein YndB with AHSA1/START domain